MNEGDYSGFQILLFVFRIGITIYCVIRAGELNRSKVGWGVFGFLIPLVALIWIQFIKPKTIWEEQSRKTR